MRICALDLGTKTGFAVGNDGAIETLGTWTLATAKEIKEAGKTRLNRRQDPRIFRLWNRLDCVHREAKLDWIVFEDVQFSSSTQQTQLWSSFRGVVWLFAYIYNISIDCLATGKLKLYATGCGSADKSQMAWALIRERKDFFKLDVHDRVHYRFGEVGNFLDDNAVDAAHLLFWAMKTFRK